MTKEVTGCMDCPFANHDYDVCVHPHREGRIEIELKEVPCECPLKKEPITISIKQ